MDYGLGIRDEVTTFKGRADALGGVSLTRHSGQISICDRYVTNLTRMIALLIFS